MLNSKTIFGQGDMDLPELNAIIKMLKIDNIRVDLIGKM